MGLGTNLEVPVRYSCLLPGRSGLQETLLSKMCWRNIVQSIYRIQYRRYERFVSSVRQTIMGRHRVQPTSKLQLYCGPQQPGRLHQFHPRVGTRPHLSHVRMGCSLKKKIAWPFAFLFFTTLFLFLALLHQACDMLQDRLVVAR